MALSAGTRLGPYEIVAPLGAGGMGEVYRARDERLGRDVAVKLLSAELSADPEQRRRFEQEVRAAAALDHPGILAVHDVGDHEGRPYLVTELLEGATLRERLAEGKIPPKKAAGWGVEIATALAAAHERRIIHRDLKPENLFVTADGRVKILDFGLAKVTAPAPPGDDTVSVKQPAATDPGTVLGTAGYMSPEQVRGQAVDHRTDIFSLGCVLYEMLAGRRAFRRDTAADTLAAILKEEPPALLALQPDVPPPLARLVSHCLEKRPEERFQSARDLAFELRAVLEDTGGTRALRGLENIVNRRRLAVLSVIALALVAVGVGGFLLLRKANPAPALSLESRRIVVAVFENETGDPALNPLGRMASDWITQGLSRVEGLDVVPSTSVLFAQAGSDASGVSGGDPVRALAGATGAGTVVSGAIYRQGQALQFQARVTDAASGRLIHALDPVTGTIGAPMQAIDALRQQVAGAMAMEERADAGHGLPDQRPPLYDAYREFIAGFEQFGTKDEEALRHFRRAREIDPDFYLPCFYEAYIFHTLGREAEAGASVRFLEDHRQQLSPNGRWWVDCMRSFVEHRFLEALQATRECEKLTPQDPIVNTWRSYLATLANRPQEAVDSYSRLERDYWKHHVIGEWRIGNFASALHELNEHPRELEVVRQSLVNFPESLSLRVREVRALSALGRVADVNRVIDEIQFLQSRGTMPDEVMLEATLELRAHGQAEASRAMADRLIAWCRARPAAASVEREQAGLAFALALQGREREAQAAYEKLAAAHPGTPEYAGALAVLAAGRGDRAGARRISEKLQDFRTPGLYGANTYQRARIAAVLGERDLAVEFLRQAFAEGLPYTIRIHQDPAFESLRDYPPFQELLRPKG